MITKSISENLNKEIYNFREACIFLDYSGSYLYKLTHTRQIPHYKTNGKKLYFKRTDLEGWLLRNRVKTSGELEQEAIEYVTTKKGKWL